MSDHDPALLDQAATAVRDYLKRFPALTPPTYPSAPVTIGATEHDIARVVLDVVAPRLDAARSDADRFQAANREHIDRIDELEAAADEAKKQAAMSAGNESDLMVAATNAEIRAEQAEAEVQRLHVVVDQEARARHEAEALVCGMRGAVVAALDVLVERLRPFATTTTEEN